MVESNEKLGLYKLPHAVLRAQADALKIPLLFFNSTLKESEENFKGVLLHIVTRHKLNSGVLNAITNEKKREWASGFCQKLGVQVYEPLWKKDSKDLLMEFIDLGFKAKIVAVHEKKLSRDFLWQELDKNRIEEFSKKNINLCGENGEYHAVVYDGPLFSTPLVLKAGEVFYQDKYWGLELG